MTLRGGFMCEMVKTVREVEDREREMKLCLKVVQRTRKIGAEGDPKPSIEDRNPFAFAFTGGGDAKAVCKRKKQIYDSAERVKKAMALSPRLGEERGWLRGVNEHDRCAGVAEHRWGDAARQRVPVVDFGARGGGTDGRMMKR
jgi:hypothetical protein